MATSKTIEERLSAIEDEVGLKTKTTRILVIQDRSGSMSGRVNETINGYNEYVTSLANDDSDKAYLTLIQFDDRYEVKEESTPVERVNELNKDTYIPRGMTALYDAVGRGITDFKKEMKKGDRALVVIMTDGLENSSTRYNRQKVASLIRECEDEGNWSFVYLGAGEDSWSGAGAIGLTNAQSVFYGKDAFSHEVAYMGLSSATANFRGAEGEKGPIGVLAQDVMVDLGGSVKVDKDSKSEEE